jgi:ABC-type sugar transport system substrate-binding protein
MRASSLRRLLAALALAAAVAAPAAAQTPRQFCDVTVANEPPNGDPLHPGAVYAAFSGQIERNEWGLPPDRRAAVAGTA